jgi:hypothetical protein
MVGRSGSARTLATISVASSVLAACALVAGVGDGLGFGDAGVDAAALPPDATVGTSSPDASPDASGASTLRPSDPNAIACNGSVCVPGQTRCCIDTSGTRCLSTSSIDCAATEINCDEKADCPAGNVCCLTQDNNNTPVGSTYCRTSCAPNDAIVCKSDQECPDKPCRLVQCGRFSIGTCGGLVPAVCAMVTMGETGFLTGRYTLDVPKVVGQEAVLDVDATLQSLSLFVTTSAGNLRLGVYDNSGSSGGPGNKVAETAEITPVVGLNTASVTTPVPLRKGTYWLAFTTSSDLLEVPMEESGRYAQDLRPYQPLPPTFEGVVNAFSRHFSLFATLTP